MCMAALARDHTGSVVWAIISRLNFRDPLIGEAAACFLALDSARIRKHNYVLVESDSETVIKALKGSHYFWNIDNYVFVSKWALPQNILGFVEVSSIPKTIICNDRKSWVFSPVVACQLFLGLSCGIIGGILMILSRETFYGGPTIFFLVCLGSWFVVADIGINMIWFEKGVMHEGSLRVMGCRRQLFYLPSLGVDPRFVGGGLVMESPVVCQGKRMQTDRWCPG
uniref:RNase H type-1 domain-containing protein n=1 Tax=Cannabis sativa TaxID=3483 RepID=A0A803QEH0_CANSA